MSTFKKMLLGFLVIGFSGISNAALITANGSSVSFTYDSALLGLFGTPSVSGDSLIFSPQTFIAKKENTIGGQLTSSTFAVKITSLYGAVIDKIALVEKGDYILEGDKAKVIAKGELRAIDLANPLTTYIDNITTSTTFSQTEFDGPTGKWEASANLDLLPDSSSAIITIENILRAKISSGNNGDELAFIEKKFVSLAAVTTVPLPQAVWLFGTGLLGLLSVSKRRNII